MGDPQFTVRIGARVGNPTDEQTAREAAAFAARSGHLDVALLRRESPEGAWLAQDWSAPSRLTLVNKPIRNTVGRN